MNSALRCPSCGAPADAARGTCPSCDTPLPWNADETRLASPDPDATRLAASNRPAEAIGHGSGSQVSGAPRSGTARSAHRSRGVTSSSGWASSTSDIDHGRFEPGAIFDDRYRILGRLGKGGMGEVYRADDLKLGQPVALKFLPEAVDRDPARLTQLHTEVRMARQVSHPNVCRVYDVGEFEGHTFLSMEYVDGEDLASLLRRIGRFPQDRAIELARQTCAGLAAAHDRGVVHRDLKPANIMLDGSGRIRITDFGLAGATGETLRAGTPAYMAPEQLAGGEVTPRSDIYALGLVLYELFTGQRALDAPTMAELIARREQGDIVPPTALVRDLDEGIERAIMRCLDPDPARRPPSALAVSAALPGGDPLAAALAAGQTPSPEMVAAAGTAGTMSAAAAMTIGAAIVIAGALLIGLYQRAQLSNIALLPKPPAALADRAQEIVAKLGYGDNAAASASGFATSRDWANYIAATSNDPSRWNRLRVTRPETYVFWYRTSPRVLRPIGDTNPIEGLNPPMTIAGMTLVVVDPAGRLVELLAVPEPIQPDGAAPARADWNALFDAAGLPIGSFTPVAPRWRPSVFADERMAWEGKLPELPDVTVRVEAAATAGRPVFFAITGPWSRSLRTQTGTTPPLLNRITAAITSLIMPSLMLAGALLARRNLKSGRGDRRGALRAATAVFLLLMGGWLLGNNHTGSLAIEVERMFGAISVGLFNAALVWLAYLGVEPYVRRFSADTLIGWSRLLAGNWRDPRVGRDVAIGVIVGLAMTVVFAAHNLVPPLLGQPEPMPFVPDPTPLIAVRYALARIFGQVQDAMTSAMLGLGGFVVLRIWLGNRLLAGAISVVLYVGVVMNGMFSPGSPAVDLAFGLIITSAFVGVLGWAGLLTAISTLATHFVLMRAPLTADFSSWRAPTSFVFLGAVLLLGVGGCYIAARPAPRAAARI
ncbi:MAG TPA: serine/threonine-protein kinase [Vicinamibacterales bacterium]|nr:serine/threonine-protein kinase [Vicinamibacterales bacterium]